MRLTSEAHPPLENATEADVERLIGGAFFGGFAAIHKDEDAFLQVGAGGRPAPWAFDQEPGTWERDFAEGCRAFTRRTGSDLWILDHFDPDSNENHTADGCRTLGEVTEAFLAYLRGDDAWRVAYTWTPARLLRGRLPEIPR